MNKNIINKLSKAQTFMVLILFTTNVFSQDPNFHIYLAFGQSNMEGAANIEAIDQTVDPRFGNLSAVTCGSRTLGTWYDAIPPLVRCNTNLGVADYFGRTMVAGLPSNIKVGIINVAIRGTKIELFDEDTYEDYKAELAAGNKSATYRLSVINNFYAGNPYRRLVDMAQLAQQSGIIKGIIMHQGESNWGDKAWPTKVKGVYDNLIADLVLDAAATPLLVGEIVSEHWNNGVSALMNDVVIASLPNILPNSYVISSVDIPMADAFHFTSAGYRTFGMRYGNKMLEVQGSESVPPTAASIIVRAKMINGASD
jgi:hypothetical protein